MNLHMVFLKEFIIKAPNRCINNNTILIFTTGGLIKVSTCDFHVCRQMSLHASSFKTSTMTKA